MFVLNIWHWNTPDLWFGFQLWTKTDQGETTNIERDRTLKSYLLRHFSVSTQGSHNVLKSHWYVEILIDINKIKIFSQRRENKAEQCPWLLIDSELKSVPFNLLIFFHPLVITECPGVLYVSECQSNLTITSPHITFNIFGNFSNTKLLSGNFLHVLHKPANY